jgi:transposase
MTTSAIVVTTHKQDPPLRPERIYVGIDLGYREHVAAATPLPAFNPQHRPEGWKRIRTLKFSSDAAGCPRLKRYLDRLSVDAADFLVLLEPTGGYYGLSLIMFLLGKGYRVLQVDNRTVKEYREKVFGLEAKTDDADARLMARMGFLHEMVGESFRSSRCTYRWRCCRAASDGA